MDKERGIRWRENVCDIRTANIAFIHTIPNITIPQNSGISCVFDKVLSVSIRDELLTC